MPGKLIPHLVPQTIEEVKANFLILEDDDEYTAKCLTMLVECQVSKGKGIAQAFQIVIDERVENLKKFTGIKD